MSSTNPLASDRARRPRTSVRTDVQGLRAVAVLAVMFGHLTGVPAGGFVGVDIFFVISGFLITGLLLREHARSGRISLADFYRRRVRRILPMALLVLVLTVAAANLLFVGGRRQQVNGDALWTVVFGANWHFALAGTDYFNAQAAPSPLQHYWSLAVEEQFYIVWPLLLILALAVAGVARRRSRSVIPVVFIALVIGASFVWAMVQSSSLPTVAYFSTFTRAWELGVGALLALAAGALERLPDVVRTPLAAIGIIGIAASFVLIGPTSTFPAPWAALPVLAAAAVIVAGTGRTAPLAVNVLIDNPVMHFIGDISYSLYLWHWPIIILLGAVLPHGPEYYLVAIALSMLLATFSYYLVESPIRDSQWLQPRARRRVRPAVSRGPASSMAVKASAVGVIAVVVVGLVGAAYARVAPQPVPVAQVVPQIAAPDGPKATALSTLVSDVAVSTSVSSWGPLTPSLNALPRAQAPEWVDDGCLDVDAANAAHCVYGARTAPKTAVLLGDSVGVSWMPALRVALPASQWRIHVLTQSLCPSADVRTASSGVVDSSCAAHRAWALRQTASLRPDLVILADSYTSYAVVDPKSGSAADAWRVGLEHTIADVKKDARRVVVFTAPPGSGDLQACVTALSKPSDCVRGPSTEWRSMSAGNDAAALASDITILNPLSWLCYQSRYCPAVIGSTPVYVDGVHLTAAMSKRLGPVLAGALASTSN